MKIKLRHDSRSKRWSVAKTFGQVPISDFPLEFQIKDTIPDYVQPIGDVKCTAITVCDIASDKDRLVYDHIELFNRINSDQNGAVPQEVIGEGVKNGLLPVGQMERIKVFNSFYEPHSGDYDEFDNCRSSLQKINYPVAVWTNWYDNWYNKTVFPVGENALSGHCWDIEGWKIVNGEPMLIAEVWLGYKVYIPRKTFNKAVSEWGCGTAVLSTLQMDMDRRKTIIESIKDALINIYLATIQFLQDEVKKKLWNTNQ